MSQNRKISFDPAMLNAPVPERDAVDELLDLVAATTTNRLIIVDPRSERMSKIPCERYRALYDAGFNHGNDALEGKLVIHINGK